jgi:hypothetical protein
MNEIRDTVHTFAKKGETKIVLFIFIKKKRREKSKQKYKNNKNDIKLQNTFDVQVRYSID